MQPKIVLKWFKFALAFFLEISTYNQEKKMKSIEESNYTLAKQICTMRNGWHKPLEGKQR